jgi:hypothetical protein
MSKTYKLINPFISGDFDKEFKADTSIKAADLAYQSLSKHFSNNLPVFHFSLQQVSDELVGGGNNHDYKHFKVTESKKNVDGRIECKYKIIPQSVNNKHLEQFKNKITKFNNQKGGLDYVDVFMDDDYDDLYVDDDEFFYTPSYISPDPPSYMSSISQAPPSYMSSVSPYIYTDTHVYRRPITYFYYDPFLYRTDKIYIPTFIAPLKPYIEIEIYTN